MIENLETINTWKNTAETQLNAWVTFNNLMVTRSSVSTTQSMVRDYTGTSAAVQQKWTPLNPYNKDYSSTMF